MNIYAPNDQMQQTLSLRDLSYSVLNSYANKTLLLGDDFICALTELDKQWGSAIELKKLFIEGINNLIIGHFRITFSLLLKASLGAHPFI